MPDALIQLDMTSSMPAPGGLFYARKGPIFHDPSQSSNGNTNQAI